MYSLGLTSFNQHNVSKIQSCYCTSNLFFLLSFVLHFMIYHFLFISFPVSWHLDSFKFGAIQWYAGTLAGVGGEVGWGRENTLICTIWQFPWYKYFGYGQFQTAWLNNKLAKFPVSICNLTPAYTWSYYE